MICYKCLTEIKTEEPKQCGLHLNCFREWFSLSDPQSFKDVQAKSTSSRPAKSASDGFTKNKSHFHGRYKKYVATLGGISYVLKVKDEPFPELPGTEYLCNQIAEYLKIEVPPFYFILFEETIETFVSRNFMQDYVGNLNHIHIFFDKDEDFNCENIVKIIAEKTGRLSEIERFIEACLFDALVGNHDRHGANIGFVQTKKGLQLAPFYDNPSYLGIETEELLGAHHEPRGMIATSATDKPTMKDYAGEFIRLGYKEIILKFRGKINLEEIWKLIDSAFISIKRKNAIKRLIERRFGELQNALS